MGVVEPSPVTDLLARGGVLYDVPGADREAVLAATVDRLPLPDGVDRDRLLTELLGREALASTAIGDGLAIPHPQDGTARHMPQALLTLAFLAQPVAYDAPDGAPVFALFVLLSQNAGQHLRLLAHLGRILQSAEVRAVLARRAAAAEILAAFAREEAQHGAPVS